MGRASIKIDLGDSLMTENWKGPYSEDKRKREERRLKRRAVRENEFLKLNGCASDTRNTVKSRGKMPVLSDEIDEDYRMFLDTYVSDIDSASDNNVDGSDIGVNTGYHSDNDDDDADPEYKKFLENFREDGNSYVYSCFVNNKLVHVRYEDGEKEEERLCKKPKLDTKMSKDLTHNNKTGNLRIKRCGSKRKQTGGPMECQQSLETERGPSNKKPRQDVSTVPKNNCHSDSKSIRKSSSVRQNSQVSDQAFDSPNLKCEIDEDYLLFLNSTRIVDGDLVYMPDKNTTKTSKVEDDSNSSDSDLILIEPNSIGENTPFISSKTYDSSCFENEKNPTDSKQNPSQFRRRLMEYLKRPYDQQEYDVFLHEVHQQRQSERHMETRQGVVKSYRAKGVHKSYLQLYPDLAKAIAEFKEPHRLLFLLRGFVYWLQNLSHDGVFRPWLDKSCMEILRKM